MSFIRFTLDLAVKQPMPDALKYNLNSIKQAFRDLKTYATKINEGKSNEELTIKAVYHICHHDTNEPCEPEQEV